MAVVTVATIPVDAAADFSTHGNNAVHATIIEYNRLMRTIAQLALPFTSDGVLVATALSRGTTVTLSTAACTITIGGVPVVVAASANTALGAILTITANTWGIIAVDAVAAGTITFSVVGPGATQAYATEALAIAAAPAKTASKARIGYLTILTATDATWVAATDSLAGGATGNVATTTNYYPIASPWELTAQSANAITLGSIGLTAKQVGNMSGSVLTSAGA